MIENQRGKGYRTAKFLEPGAGLGLKTEVLAEMLAKKPEDVIKRAVWGMIPKNKLGRAVYKKLKVYRGPEHPHQARNPRPHAF